MKINLKDNKFGVKHLKGINPTKLILFFIITGWIRVLAIVIPGIWIYINTQEWRTNDNVSAVKMEQRNRFSAHRFTDYGREMG